jgi:hypothetical protein
LDVGFGQLKPLFVQSNKGAPAGSINASLWSATLAGDATFGVTTFNPTALGNSFKMRVNMTYFNLAQRIIAPPAKKKKAS